MGEEIMERDLTKICRICGRTLDGHQLLELTIIGGSIGHKFAPMSEAPSQHLIVARGRDGRE